MFNGVAFGSTNRGVVMKIESVVNEQMCKKRYGQSAADRTHGGQWDQIPVS